MKPLFLFLLLILLPLFSTSFTIDLAQNNKYSNSSLLNTLCNKDTQIDFAFSSNTLLQCSSSCQLSEASSSSLKFLDVTGEDLELTLKSAEFTSDSFIDGRTSSSFAFTFQTQNASKTVYVIIPVIFSSSTETYVIDLDTLNQNEFSTLAGLTGVTSSFALSSFNFMNLVDFGHFYHATNSDKTSTVLVSSWTYYLPNDFASEAVSSTIPSLSFAYSSTGDKLCYGSQENEGLFQTHMRESVPLWTAWFAIFFYWMYYLLTDTHPVENYDKKFEQNKWTCWAFYSLHYLGHDEYFSKLSRLSLLLFNFSFQAIVLAALYMSLGAANDATMIIWAALAAFAASLPFPFILGGTFLNYIKETTLEKFRTTKKLRSLVGEKKESESRYQKDIDQKEEKLYGLYYWYYVIIFICFISFWTVSVHLMQQTHRDNYYLHYYWQESVLCRLASLGISFVLDNLVFDIFLTLLLGSTSFYQMKGFYYDYKLGEEFKQTEQ